MDKSESEILEEWDLVSSVYDSEQEKNQTEVKTETQTEHSETSSNSISETCNNNVPEIHTNTESENKSDTSEKTNEGCIDSEQKAHSDSVKTVEPVISEGKETVEPDSQTERELHSEEGTVDAVEEAAAEGDTEEMSEPDTEEITVIETIMYDVKKISDVDSESNIVTNIEKISSAAIKEGSPESKEETGDTALKASDDNAAKECFEIKTSHNKDSGANAELKADSVDCPPEQAESSTTNLPEMYPVFAEHETASIESSSSDIDIIDENMEDSVSSSFLHPLSLSISSSVDTSSVLTPSSEDNKNTRIEDIRLPEESESYSIKSETHPKISEVHAEKTIPKQSHYDYQQPSEKKSEKVHKKPPQHHRDTHSNMFGAILQFLRSMKCLEWSLLGGVVLGLYLTVVFNQTNIFAVVEKEDVVFQMKNMIDDLKYDNKLLKDQMLSEMKNEKVFSSFEHQIKELRKENSRLNHMLYDVAKVLDKQKDAHDKYEKKEGDYLAPFKKEINKLKEQINNLKIDNEDLQKQLVRIRYASYSQGANDDKSKKKKEEIKTEEVNSADEIPIDIASLKKWNELISLLSKELGLSLENDPQSKGNAFSESRKNISWYWKVFLRDFKGTFDEFKANITSKFSDYKKVQENTISDIYKFVKNFFTVEEQNNQQFIPPADQSSRWNNFGDFFSDLKDKWSKIKNRIDTSDLKSFFKDFKMSGDDETPQYESKKPKSPPFERNERKPTNVHFESERKPTDTHFGSDRKHDKAQKESEDTKWMFERAALRAELRETEKDEVNWFLKKNKHLSEDDSEENKY